MLTGLLEKNQCAECRFCCVFDISDFWEMPTLLKNTAKQILTYNPNTILKQVEDCYTFDISNITSELYPCPALSSQGCKLSKTDKPFECSIWPFRVMSLNDNLVLTICTDCSALKDVSTSIIDTFANDNIRNIAMDYAKKYPQIVKPYHENYRIIPCE